MAYRLKKIKFRDRPCHILLQNENGPCPLLAAANVLLLKDSITLPSGCTGAGVVTIDQLVNVLAEKILINNDQAGMSSDRHVQEVMDLFPTLQFGMDVNPKFTEGPSGVEYTPGLDAFDLLRVTMVHGWLIDPEAPEYPLVKSKTYNELINMVVEGNDAGSRVLEKEDDDLSSPLRRLSAEDREALSTKANEGTIIRDFLESSCHQLTQYGLTVLHEHVEDGQMAVFFRNNHFNSLVRSGDNLYLLVTDVGYARAAGVVWEKLDVIDGDTEYVDQAFRKPAGGGGPAAAGDDDDPQSRADYHLALQLSRETAAAAATTTTTSPAAALSFGGEAIETAVPAGDPMSEEDRDRMVALRLQQQEQACDDDDDVASRNLALRLQRQEDEMVRRRRQHRHRQANAAESKRNGKDGSCAIM